MIVSLYVRPRPPRDLLNLAGPLAPWPDARVVTMGDLDPNGIISPPRDELGRETDLLLERIKMLANDWFESDNGVTQEQLARWRAFVTEVTDWDAGPRAFTHLIGTTWRDELIAYQRRFNGFAAEFRAAGVPGNTPFFTFVPPAPGTLDRLGDAAGNAATKLLDPFNTLATGLKWTAIVGGVAVVGLLFYAVREAGSIGRTIGPRVLR